MAGLTKPKQYDWKDSNLALFGSDVERSVKYDSAKTETAWQGSGQEVGLQIWRIVKFKVTHWPKEDYGKFYNGDSYIILNTYHPTPTSKDLCYNLHFWIGSKSTQDEYGTAAYKTVELDTFHHDKPVQFREVEGHESELFKSYFKSGIVIWEGGAETGFKHVEPKKYTPRLLHFEGDKKHVFVREVPRSKERLVSGDVFILDSGEVLYQWNGSGSNKDERFKALQVAIAIKSERGGKCRTETLEEDGTPLTHPFYQALDQPNIKDLVFEDEPNFKTTLFKVSDASGNLTFTKVKETNISLQDLRSDDVFIIDTSKECFVWIGSKATQNEKMNGMPYAHTHLMKTKHPLVNIIVLKEGQKNDNFSVALAA